MSIHPYPKSKGIQHLLRQQSTIVVNQLQINLILLFIKFLYILSCLFNLIEYEMDRPNLKYIRIYFDTPVFDKVSKDQAAKFVDILSAIGGTMGLLTGFSIISGVEILFFGTKIILKIFKKIIEKKINKDN